MLDLIIRGVQGRDAPRLRHMGHRRRRRKDHVRRDARRTPPGGPRDYSPWEGWTVKGWPAVTILRGKVIVENGKLLASLDHGRLVPRRIDPAMLRRPAA